MEKPPINGPKSALQGQPDVYSPGPGTRFTRLTVCSTAWEKFQTGLEGFVCCDSWKFTWCSLLSLHTVGSLLGRLVSLCLATRPRAPLFQELGGSGGTAIASTVCNSSQCVATLSIFFSFFNVKEAHRARPKGGREGRPPRALGTKGAPSPS
jgi:hypothetical protein